MRGGRPDWDTTKLTIKAAPRPREVYWIGMFTDSTAPEFTGYHPGIILSGAKSLNVGSEHVTFVPLTSSAPRVNDNGAIPPHILPLSANPNPVNNRQVWAICSHVMTVRLTRLERYVGERGQPVVPRISPEDFDGVLDAVGHGIVSLRNRFDTRMKSAMEDMRAFYEDQIEMLHEEFQATVDQRVEEAMQEMTAPRKDSYYR